MQIDKEFVPSTSPRITKAPEKMTEEEWLAHVKPGRYETPFWQFVAILGWAAAAVLAILIMLDRPIF